MKLLWIIVATLATIGGIVIIIMLVIPKPPIPGPIKAQVTSAILVPHSPYTVIDRSSVTYNSKESLLIFTVKSYGIKTVFSEQATPDTFNTGLTSYSTFIKNMEKYSQFDVDAGTVYLTKPPQQHGSQVAIINTKGTLVFVKPSKDLILTQWRQLFSSLVVLH